MSSLDRKLLQIQRKQFRMHLIIAGKSSSVSVQHAWTTRSQRTSDAQIVLPGQQIECPRRTEMSSVMGLIPNFERGAKNVIALSAQVVDLSASFWGCLK